jgi:hypothetical protein
MSSSSPDPPERQSSSTPLLAHESLESNGSSSNVSSDNEIQENTIHSGNRLRYMRTARRTLSLLASPLTDDRGHWQAVSAGLSTMLVAGAVLGLVLPKNPDFPDLWYRSVSACLGYTYFFCWSVSFYPQVLTNYRRQTCTGLSADFCVLNVLGFMCYATYCTALFGSARIQALYRERHGADAEITVVSP